MMETSLANQMAAMKKDAVAIQEKQQGGEEDEDLFTRLPDELIISQIFDRLYELRYLFMCSLVSRRFASLIFQTHNVAVRIPRIIESDSLSLLHRFKKFLSKPFSFLKQLLLPTKQLNKPSYDSDDKSFSSLFSGFFGNLSSVRYLKAEISSNRDDTHKKFLVKWLFESKSANSGRFMILFSKSLTTEVDPDTDDADDNSNSTGNRYDEMSIDEAISFVPFIIADGLLFYYLLSAVVPFFPKFKRAVISDSIKQGWLVAREETIVHMRTGDEDLKDIYAHLKVWDVDVVKLPQSGVVMKDAILGIVRLKIGSEMGEDELIAEETNWELEKDEEEIGVFGEAVRVMMKNDAVSEETLGIKNPASRLTF